MKKRMLNFRLLALLVVSCAAVGLGVYLLHGYRMRSLSKAFIRQADQAQERGQIDKEADYLRRYLAYKPDAADVMARYGLTLDLMADSPRDRLQSYQVLDHSLRVDPGRADIRRKVARMALELGRYDDASDHLGELLKGRLDDGELHYLDGWCHEGKGEDAKAVDSYKEAIKHDPGRVETYRRYARLLRRTDRTGSTKPADGVMDRLVERNGRSPRAYLERAAYRKEFGLGGAAGDLARALELAPDDGDVLVAFADQARSEGRLDEARRRLERGLERHPDDGRIYQALSQVELQAGRPKRAAEVLRRGCDRLPKRHDLTLALAAVLVQGGEPGKARQQVERLRGRQGVAPEWLTYIDACCDVAEQKWPAAVEKLDGVRALAEDRPELMKQAELMLAECHGRRAEVADSKDERRKGLDEQLAAYRRVLAVDPSSSRALVGVASTLVALDRVDEAIEGYRTAVLKVPRATEARIGLARLLIARSLGQPASQRQWQEVEQVLAEADRASPRSVEVALLRAGVLAAKGQPDRARELLVKARDEQPDRVELWVALADAQDGPESILPILDDAQRKLGGDPVEIRLARARYWSRRGGVGAAAALAELGRGLERYDDADRRRLLMALAAAYTATGHATEAKRLGDRLAAQAPEDLGIRTAAFELALRDGDEAAMDRELGALKKIEGSEGASWPYQRARRLIWQVRRDARRGLVEAGRLRTDERLAEARKLLAEVAAKRPDTSDVPRVESEIGELQGDQAGALASLRKAIALGDRDPRVVGRAVQLMAQDRRYDEADRLIDDLQQKGPLPGEIRKLAAEAAARNQDRDHALELARKAVAAQAQDYRDLLWLGGLLGSLPGHEVEAEQALRRAVDRAGSAPQAWVALVGHLARTRQAEKAEAAIRDARHRLTGDQASLALAQCYEVIGRKDRAEELYLAALEARPGDASVLRSFASFRLRAERFQDAKPLLRRIAEVDPEGDDGAWARRTLALALAAGGDARRSREALKALGLSEGHGQSADADTVADQRARAMVLATQRGRQQRLEAIRLFERLDGRGLLTTEERFVLAQLYGAVGDWPKERREMQGLLDSGTRESRYLVHFVNRLVKERDLDAARQWLGRLEAADPRSFATVAAKVRLLKAEGEHGEVDRALEGYARGHEDQILGVAALLEELDRHAAAEKIYREYASQPGQPERVLVLAGYLGRRGRVKDALDLCEGAWRTCPPEKVSETCVAAFNLAPGDDQQVRRVERWIEGALKEAPGSTPLLAAMAGLRMVQGRYPEAEAAYRQVIERDGGNVVALNNLAYLLAFEEGKGDEAAALINQAVDILGPVPDLLDTRAVVYLRTNRANQAIADLLEDVAASPAAAKYFHLAQAYQLAGDRASATTALDRAKSMGLKVEALHPAERVAYQQMLDQLARN